MKAKITIEMEGSNPFTFECDEIDFNLRQDCNPVHSIHVGQPPFGCELGDRYFSCTARQRRSSTFVQMKQHSDLLDRDKTKKILEGAFRKEFPQDTVDISDGYQEHIHILIVSRRFDDMDRYSRDDLMWSIIEKASLSEEEKGLISSVLSFSPGEIK